MYKASQFNTDTVIELLEKNEFRMLLVEADKANVFDIIARQTTYEDRQCMMGKEKSIQYYLYPLNYKNKSDEETEVYKSRLNTTFIIFHKWTEAGYNKHHAKNPFACKTFMKFLNKIEFFGADYMLLAAQ